MSDDPTRLIDPERHARIKAIAEAALDLPTNQRQGFVADRCGADTALRSAVDDWLAAVRESDRDDFLGAAPSFDAPVEIGEGERRYRIEREIGRGGMGAVYLAERSGGGYTQKVALKLIGAAAGRDPELLRRFGVERQILADLAHPNIARLLDGGHGRDGRPFLVMEFVDGVRIDDWCERSVPDAAGRVRLLLKVCAAVAYAHRHLVVHRDIKPANVMVDRDGEPKLLDFGIAKLLGADDAQATATHQRLMTVSYASPEQLRGRPIGTGSDVYSLGVLLYRLLTGGLPYDTAEASLPDLARAICEDEPTPPSRRIRSLPEAGRAAARSLLPDADLDHILMKCLRKEPEQRYGSVESFAEDLQRWLDGEPVQARRGSRSYRLRKFVVRHRGALAAAALLLVLLAGFGLERQRQLTATKLERDRAQRLLGFMTNLFQVADPGEARGKTITVREVLKRGVNDLGRDATLDDGSRADLLEATGTVYRRLGLLKDAEPLLTKTLDLRSAAAPRDRIRAALALASLRADQARFDDAAKLLAGAEDMRAAALADDAMLEGRLLFERGNLTLRMGKAADARPLLEQALAVRRGLSEQPSREIAEVHSALGSAAHDLGDLDGCARHYDAALKQLTAAHADPFAIARITNNLGMLAVERGDTDDGASRLELALKLLRESLGERHALVAAALVNLGGVEVQRGHYDIAEQRFTEAVEMRRALLGNEHPQTASALGNVGYAHFLQGRFDAAGDELEQAVAALKAAVGPKHPQTLSTTRNLALLRYEQGRLDASAALDRAIAADAPPGKDGKPLPLALQAGLRAAAIDWLREPSREHAEAAAAAADLVIGSTPASSSERVEAQLWRAQLRIVDDPAASCRDLDASSTVLAKHLPATDPQRLWPETLGKFCRTDSLGGQMPAEIALAQRLGPTHPLLARLTPGAGR